MPRISPARRGSGILHVPGGLGEDPESLDEKERSGGVERPFRCHENVPTYNIVGEIPGKRRGADDSASAHYDSYFSGFQDDNTAIAMMLGIARAYLKIGYQPENTWVFCGMAAEEWGKCDTVRLVPPVLTRRFLSPSGLGWKGHRNFNFELPALSTEIWTASAVPTSTGFPGGVRENSGSDSGLQRVSVSAPIETWSGRFLQ